MALIPMLKRDTRLTLADAAAALGAEPAELAQDLVVLSMCGVPPYTPDALFSVWIEGDEVVSWSDPPALSGPVRLSSEETRALTAALAAAGQEPTGDLAERLAGAAGSPEGLQDALRVRIVSRGSSVLGALAAALESSSVVCIRYLTGSSGRLSERCVHPYDLTERAGIWYLTAFCEEAREERVFRVDRIEWARDAGRAFEPPAHAGGYAPQALADAAPATCVIEFEPGEQVEERDWPGAEIERLDDGRTRARVPVADERWLARRVCARLGAARVVEPASMQESVARTANTLLEDV
jgi:predicted DNA-binding transcriptional regulator YafY